MLLYIAFYHVYSTRPRAFHPSTFHLSTCLPPSTLPPFHVPSTYPPVHLSTYPPVHLSTCLPPIHLPPFHVLSTYPPSTFPRAFHPSLYCFPISQSNSISNDSYSDLFILSFSSLQPLNFLLPLHSILVLYTLRSTRVIHVSHITYHLSLSCVTSRVSRISHFHFIPPSRKA